jgi:hypothetical protein
MGRFYFLSDGGVGRDQGPRSNRARGFIGENGCGKSNTPEAIAFAAAAFRIVARKRA